MSKGRASALAARPGRRVPPGAERYLGIIVSLVASARRVGVADLLWPTRAAADIAFARQIGMYLMHVGLGASLTETGRAFARDRTTAAHACALIEDRRDDARFDLEIHCLEAAARAACLGAANAP